jgi:hypothetical protein
MAAESGGNWIKEPESNVGVVSNLPLAESSEKSTASGTSGGRDIFRGDGWEEENPDSLSCKRWTGK